MSTRRPSGYDFATNDPEFGGNGNNGGSDEHKTPVDSPVMREIGKLTKAMQNMGETQLAIYSAVQAQDTKIAKLTETVEKREPFPRSAVWIVAACAVVVAFCFVIETASKQSEHLRHGRTEYEDQKRDQEPSRHAHLMGAIAYPVATLPRKISVRAGDLELAGGE